MKCLRLRLRGAEAKLCLLLAMLAYLAFSRRAGAEPLALSEVDGQPGVVVYPAQQPGPRRVTVVLHGMCSEPANACRHFAAEVTKNEHLVCPRASKRCNGGGSIWPHVGFAEHVERALERAEGALGAARVDSTHGRTLIGYSLGAFRALSLAEQGTGKYPRVMLIGAKVYPNQKLLRENGVQRLLLSAGTWDMMHDHMQRQTRRLARGGFSAHFLGLGPVGHFFTPSFAEYWPQALTWLDEDPASPAT
jgi:predicted esterase